MERKNGPKWRPCMRGAREKKGGERLLARGDSRGNNSVSRRVIHVEIRVKFPVMRKRTFVSGKRDIRGENGMSGKNYNRGL